MRQTRCMCNRAARFQTPVTGKSGARTSEEASPQGRNNGEQEPCRLYAPVAQLRRNVKRKPLAGTVAVTHEQLRVRQCSLADWAGIAERSTTLVLQQKSRLHQDAERMMPDGRQHCQQPVDSVFEMILVQPALASCAFRDVRALGIKTASDCQNGEVDIADGAAIASRDHYNFPERHTGPLTAWRGLLVVTFTS